MANAEYRFWERLRDHLSDPIDLEDLENSAEGKGAKVLGELQGRSDRLHGREFTPPKREGSRSTSDWALDTLQETAYRKAYREKI